MRWTPEEEAKLRELWDSGKSFREIGAILGRSGEAAYRKGVSMKLGSKPFGGDPSPTWALIVRICSDRRPRSVHEIAEAAGTSRHTVDYLMRTREEEGRAHVADWKKRPGSPIPYWLPLPGKSKPRPRSLTNTERNRAWRAKLRDEDPLAYKALIDRNTVNRARRMGTVPKPPKLLRALFASGVTA